MGDLCCPKDKIIEKSALKAKNLTCRFAALYHYALEGTLVGIWSCFLPSIQSSLSLSDTELGSAVLFFYAGSVFVNPISAYLINRYGGALATFVGASVMAIMLPLIAFATDFVGLSAIFLFLGAGLGLMDTSMNSLAILAELVSESTIMGSFHGSYSISAAIGSLIGGVLVALNKPMFNIFSIFSAITLLLTIYAFLVQYTFQEQKFILANYKESAESSNTTDNYTPLMKSDDENTIRADNSEDNDDYDNYDNSNSKMKEPLITLHDGNYGTYLNEEKKPRSGSRSLSPRTILLVLAFVGFLAAFGESGLVTWVIVYYTRYLPFSKGIYVSFGFTAFQMCMAIGRFGGDYLRIKYGRVILIKLSGILTGIGSFLVISAPILFNITPNEDNSSNYNNDYSSSQESGSLGLVTLGFAIIGCGLSYLIPTAMSTVGELPSSDGNTVAILNSLMYCGSICSSPILGATSDGLHSLRLAFVLNAAFMFLVSPCGWGVPIEKYHKVQK